MMDIEISRVVFNSLPYLFFGLTLAITYFFLKFVGRNQPAVKKEHQRGDSFFGFQSETRIGESQHTQV